MSQWFSAWPKLASKLCILVSDEAWDPKKTADFPTSPLSQLVNGLWKSSMISIETKNGSIAEHMDHVCFKIAFKAAISGKEFITIPSSPYEFVYVCVQVG